MHVPYPGLSRSSRCHRSHPVVFQTLYTYLNNFRAYKALIAAQYSGTDVKVDPAFEFGVTNKQEDFLKKFPQGKVRYLDKPRMTPVGNPVGICSPQLFPLPLHLKVHRRHLCGLWIYGKYNNMLYIFPGTGIWVQQERISDWEQCHRLFWLVRVRCHKTLGFFQTLYLFIWIIEL